MALNRSDYLQLLKSLLPQGRAWEVEKNSLMGKVLEAVSDEFNRVQTRIDYLLKELDPTQTQEMLPEWEELMGFPNDVTGSLSELTFQARKKLVYTYYTMTGGTRPEYYKQLIKNFGFDIDVFEIRNFRTGLSRVGESLTNGSWRNAFEVRTLNAPVFRFSTGLNVVGDPLVVTSNELIRKIIEENKPAHVVAIYTFGTN